ncbi:hypothetical protein MMC12_007928 [Toensbergia leucococca]|nr:hypothetical protein [Toensbergia leucococca]
MTDSEFTTKGSNRLVETITRTGGFGTKVAKRRILETFQWILQCTESLEAIQPGGSGHASSIRVRLLHAAVRQRIMRIAQQRPDYYNVEKFGVPINDLDCIETICAFSVQMIYLSLPRQGIWMREREIIDYIAFFRWVGYLCGTPTWALESPTKARAVMESLLLNEVRPSETSGIIARNIISSLETEPPLYASREYLVASARWLNGHELSDQLGLERTGL